MKYNKLIDHTLLKQDATPEQVLKLCEEAKQFEFMSVCVNPHYVPINQRDYSGKSNIMTSTTAFPNKEDPPIKNGGTSPTQLANSSFSSLTSGNGNNGEEEDVPPPSVSDMELEAEARRQFVKEQMEAEDAPQLLLLG